MKKLFTLMVLTCVALGTQAQGKYALTAGQGAIPAGTTVTSVENCSLTFGVAGEADFKDPKANASVEGYTAFTEGNGTNGSADGGTQYILQPTKDGEISVAVVLNANKAFFVLENGTALADYNEKKVEEKFYGIFKFDVKGGKTYKVYCTGSKLGFYGFEYTLKEGGDPVDPVVPTNSDIYNSIVDGQLAPEFAAVAGADGGVANNAADGKSIVVMTAGKATVTAVGGTTPANDTEMGGAAQQIVPGALVEGQENLYEVAEVKAWNDIKWERKNQGDIDFWYIAGTGNPYVGMYAKQNSKDGNLVEGSYSADYVYYEPDGSVGMPITGLYYKFTASAQGAFKVKVWANKGNRKTFVVNASTMKAERLLASGYVNGVNDESGKKKLLSVEQVDSVHNEYVYPKYLAAIRANEAAAAAGEAAKYTQEQIDSIKAVEDPTAEERKYVIGNGNQNFWGWLTFDVEPGEEYWVFQHSSQIGFGGFEFHEGVTADELINGIEAAYVYTTNFSTYENEEGERVTWKGESIVGDGQFMTTEEEGAPFGEYYQNVIGTAPRQNYCLLPEDVLAHSAKTRALTVAFWVSAEGFTPNQYTYAPLFAAYGAAPGTKGDGNNDNWPVMVLQSRGPLQINNNGWCDFGGDLHTDGKVNIYNTNAWEAGDPAYNSAGNWLEDQKWHYYTMVFTEKNTKCYLDGEVKNEWNYDGVTEGQILGGFFDNCADYKYICLGGNQAWAWADLDSPFRFARLLIKNSAMSAGEVKAQMKADFPGYEEYLAGGGKEEAIRTAVQQTLSGVAYSLSGQKVDGSYKGIVIKDGRKIFVK